MESSNSIPKEITRPRPMFLQELWMPVRERTGQTRDGHLWFPRKCHPEHPQRICGCPWAI